MDCAKIGKRVLSPFPLSLDLATRTKNIEWITPYGLTRTKQLNADAAQTTCETAAGDSKTRRFAE